MRGMLVNAGNYGAAGTKKEGDEGKGIKVSKTGTETHK